MAHNILAEANAMFEDVAGGANVAADVEGVDVEEVLNETQKNVKRARRYVSKADVYLHIMHTLVIRHISLVRRSMKLAVLTETW